jgi:peptide/nickel transport system substrate-binding protein
MRAWKRPVIGILSLALLLIGCASPPAPQGAKTDAPAGGPVATKRITATILGEPPSMSHTRTTPTTGSTPGLDAVEELVHAGLSHFDPQGRRVPRLAETVPTIENGLWRLLPDGRMETTWKMRSDASWHDGVPLTAEDVAFTARVDQDRDVGVPRAPIFEVVESVDALDPRTILVRWKRVYIEADFIFGQAGELPLPKHLLEQAYNDDKAALMQHPYWTDAFVGAGPYRMREWATGSHIVLVANDQFFLGRPKIDEIEVRFIQDVNVLIANILAGVVELNLGRGLDPEHALQIRERKDLTLHLAQWSWLPIRPQFVNPSPVVMLDVQFRRAQIHAIDRQAIADSIAGGLVPVAHSMINPSEPGYDVIEPALVKYEYDPRRATQMIEALGFRKGPDGVFLDAAGQKLGLEMRTTAQRDQQVKATVAVADFWQRIGIAAEPFVVPLQRLADREYRATFPGWEMVGGGSGLLASQVQRYHSSSAPLPENQFRSVGNNARYQNPELDALVERYTSTIGRQERLGWMREIVQHQTDRVTVMGLFYQIRPTVVAPRILNVTAGYGDGTVAWNAHLWDAR